MTEELNPPEDFFAQFEVTNVRPIRDDLDLNQINLTLPLHAVAEHAIAALANHRRVFQRSGRLVTVVRVAEDERQARLAEGTPEIRLLTPAMLEDALSEVTTFVRTRSDSSGGSRLVAATPPRSLLSALLERGEYRGIRPLVHVVEAPSMLANGTILQRAGYEPSTGVLYVPAEAFPEVADRPSQEDARAALERLREPFLDFPFHSPAAAMVPIASIMSCLTPCIPGSMPGVVFDASTPGSGKSLCGDVVSLIVTGRIASKMSYPPRDEELEKILGSYALRGAAIVNFDNVNVPYGGGPLDRVLTAQGQVDVRILGRSETPSIRWRPFIFASGNNVVLRGDVARRLLVSRIVPDTERPEERDGFRIQRLPDWCREHRARLVVDALTILRAYVVAGQPSVGLKPWGSYELWTELVAASIVWAGGANPIEARPAAIDAGDPKLSAIRGLLDGWARLDPQGRGMSARALISLLYPPGWGKADRAPDGFDDIREAIELLAGVDVGKAPDPKRLGRELGKHMDRMFGIFRLRGQKDRNGIVTWRSEKCV